MRDGFRNRRSRLTRYGGVVMLMLAVVGLVPVPAYADEVRDAQWHLDFLRIDETHQITRGEGVTVAVIDSGVDGNHPDLAGAVLEGRNFVDGQARDRAWEDLDGHGTAMASLIAGRGHGTNQADGVLGVAPAASILPVRFFDTGIQEEGNSRGLANGIEWAVDQGADVINLSVAMFSTREILEAVEYALEQDVVIVVAAGNTARGNFDVNFGAPGVVVVSGVDRQGFFSPQSVSGPEVVLAAPMVEVMAATSGQRGEYEAATGTSNSAALVSGVAALVRSRFPDLDAANVINRLIRTADDRGAPGRDPEYGFGVVDPLAALTEDVPLVDSNPLVEDNPSTSPSETTSNPQADSSPDTEEDGVDPLIIAGVAGAVLGLLLTVTFVTVYRHRSRYQ